MVAIVYTLIPSDDTLFLCFASIRADSLFSSHITSLCKTLKVKIV